MSNRPLIVGLLFIGTYFAPFLILIGLPLAYVFKGRPEEEWEQSHFQYLIRTFWIAMLFLVVAMALWAAGALILAKTDLALAIDDGGFLLFAIYLGAVGIVAIAFTGIRIINSLMKAVIRTPVANPKTWLI